ncbi:hypothetical protein [Vannielia sp. SX4]|uniref:hypothetical protein n=1 Tax=Vannielia sp. SX4 TaxID=3463852 RepID=UPI004059D7E4
MSRLVPVPAKPEANYNKRLALGIAVTGGVITAVLLVALYLVPVSLLSAIDRIGVKLVLSVLVPILICATGTMMYIAIHTPTATRFIYTVCRGIFFITLLGSAYSTFGWPRIRHIDWTPDGSGSAAFSQLSEGADVWLVMLVGFTFLLIASALFIYLKIMNHKYDYEF